MRYVEFKNEINSSDFPAILFQGEEAFFREDAVKTLKQKYNLVEGMDFDLFDGGADFKTLSSCLSCPPFINAKRLVVVKDFYPTDKQVSSSGISETLSVSQDFSVLVFVNEKPCDSLEKINGITVVNCARETSAFLSSYIVKSLLRQKVQISPRVAERLVEYCCGDMERISQEIQKLTAYVGSGGEVVLETLDLLVHRDVELQIFELTTALSKKNASESIRLLNQLLRNNEKPQIIFMAIYNAFRRMLHIALSSKTDAQLAVDLGVKEYAVKKARQAAALFVKKSLKKACDHLCMLDVKMKSGQVSADGLLLDTIQYLLSV